MMNKSAWWGEGYRGHGAEIDADAHVGHVQADAARAGSYAIAVLRLIIFLYLVIWQNWIKKSECINLCKERGFRLT
jgi:hypothetical protein